MATFSERLKELRKKKKLTQKELAEQVGVQQGAINKWESEATEPNLNTVVELAKILSSTTDYLLGFEDVNQFDIPLSDLGKDWDIIPETPVEAVQDLTERFPNDILRIKNEMKEQILQGYSQETIHYFWSIDLTRENEGDQFLDYIYQSALREVNDNKLITKEPKQDK